MSEGGFRPEALHDAVPDAGVYSWAAVALPDVAFAVVAGHT
jgi:hypothetical protein